MKLPSLQIDSDPRIFVPILTRSMRYINRRRVPSFTKPPSSNPALLAQTNPVVSNLCMLVRDRQATRISIDCKNGLKNTNAKHDYQKIATGTNGSSANLISMVQILKLPDSTKTPLLNHRMTQSNYYHQVDSPFLKLLSRRHCVQCNVDFSVNSISLVYLLEKILRFWRTLTSMLRLCRFLLVDHFMQGLLNGL